MCFRLRLGISFSTRCVHQTCRFYAEGGLCCQTIPHVIGSVRCSRSVGETRPLSNSTSTCIHNQHTQSTLNTDAPAPAGGGGTDDSHGPLHSPRACSHIRVTVAVASSTSPKKFSTVTEKVNSTPTSSAVAFSSASRDPSKVARDALTADSASSALATVLAAAVEAFQNAESVRDAAPEELRLSSWRLPHKPTVCEHSRGM